MDGGIIWLASYPKSGNTWLRIFLTNYLRDGDQPADLNDLDGGPIASARLVFDEFVGVEASDLTPEEIERYRPGVYNQMAQNSQAPIFLKVHDAYTLNQDGLPIFPKEATRGVIYLIRNPLDVAISFAHHIGQPVSEMIPRMCREDFAFASRSSSLNEQLGQKLLSWSGHVLSWVDEPGLNVHVVRYEDMLSDNRATFTAILRFIGLEVDEARLDKAMRFSSFDRLQATEEAQGFRERSPKAQAFFRQGKTGGWRQILSEDQVAALIASHRTVMHRFGYLGPDDIPLC
jgi:hypothetical protein